MIRNILLSASVFPLSIGAVDADDPKKAADSTGKKTPDRGSKPPTSTDQPERPEERRLPQAIREAVMKDQSLSMTAKNVAIVTANNRVTLRGWVKNAGEKFTINNLARAAAGEIPVDNRLEVKAPK